MSRRRRFVLRLGLPLFVAAYVAAVYWVFTRSTPMGEDRDVTIRIAHWQIELGPPDGIGAAIKRYEELNPHVRVKQMLIPGAVYQQWLRANFAGDTAPDIVEYGVWLNGLEDLPVRYFEPLTNELLEPNPYNRGTALQGVPWVKTFADELLEQRLFSPEPGQYYSVTLSRGSQRLFCNRTLYRAITGRTEPPADFAELRTVFAQTAEYGRRQGRTIYPFAGSRDNAFWLMAFYMGAVNNGLGARLDHYGILGLYPRDLDWTFLRGEWNYQNPSVKAGLRLLAELDAQMKPGYMQFARDEAVRQFLRGEALFLFAGTWEATSLRRLAEFPVDALRCPQPTKSDPVVGRFIMGHCTDGDNITGFGLYLNKYGKHQREAVDFLRFLTSYEGDKLFTDHSGWPPSVRTVPVAPDIASYLSPADGYSYGGPNVVMGGSSLSVLRSNLYLLSGPQGSADKLAEALDQQMPAAGRDALADEGRAARWAVLPQDTRIAALDGLQALLPGDAAVTLRRERLEAAQNLSEARALLIARQLQMLDARGQP
ncbi:MAG: ABC transporter substrate-binding protein [Opitutales bacterium]